MARNSDVVVAFNAGKAKAVGHIHTNGRYVFSYAMLIAARVGDEVLVIDRKYSPSQTTSTHISEVQYGCSNVRIVDKDTLAKAYRI